MDSRSKSHDSFERKDRLSKTKVTYTAGDIVWAKVRGHAWWPAIVGKEAIQRKNYSEAKYEVHFMGDATRAQLTVLFLRPFEKGFLESAFMTMAKRGLKEAIMQACRRYAK